MITIVAVGDLCPGDTHIPELGICGIMRKNPSKHFLSDISAIVNDSDIAIGNLEGPLSIKVKPAKSPDLRFCGLPSFADELKKSGFTVISVANNHILEHGKDIFYETVQTLEKAGLLVCGLIGDNGYYSKPVIIDINNYKVGILSYNWIGKDKFVDTDRCIAQSHDSVVNYTWSRTPQEDQFNQANAAQFNKNVLADISKLKQETDYVILYTHWGYEFVHIPPYGVKMEAKSFIDGGCDLIIGTHPHVLQGYEQYNRKWIFYSLGNMLFDIGTLPSRQSMILKYNISKSSEEYFSLIKTVSNSGYVPHIADKKSIETIENLLSDSNKAITSTNCKSLLNDDTLYKNFEEEYNRRKVLSIVHHFALIPKHPLVLKIIFRKFINLVKLLLNRIAGRKVRW